MSEGRPSGTRLMSLVRWLLVAVTAVAAVASLAWYEGWIGGRGGSASAKQNTFYTCPMHPGIHEDHPGECPICGMTLVPVTVGAAAPSSAPSAPGARAVPGLAPLELSAERVQLMGLRTAPVVRRSLSSDLRTVAYVQPSERAVVQVSSRAAGWIEELPVAETGMRVSRGQVLATIYSPELLAAEQELLNARRWAADDRAPAGGHDGASHEQGGLLPGLQKDAHTRLQLLGIAADDIAEIERSGQPLHALPLRAPAGGYVTQKQAQRGLHVEAGAPLFEIADLSTVWVLADVNEADVGRVHEGQEARLELAAFPGSGFPGKVSFLYPTVDGATRTLKVRLVFKNDGMRLRPGMHGSVRIVLAKVNALVVPSEAVVDTGDAQYVFLARASGRFEPRRVVVGARDGGDVQVTSGLDEGESVVTTANFLLDSESRLRAAVEGTAGAGASQPAGAPPSGCDANFDKQKYPDKYEQCRACEVVHRGMGSMVDDCKNAIPRPWR